MAKLSHSKKLLSFITAVCLVFGAAATLPQSTTDDLGYICATAEESGIFTYDINHDGTVTVTGCTSQDEEIVVPSELDGKKVTAVGKKAFENNTFIEKVTVSSGITEIGEQAFSGCVKITQVLLPSSVATISEKAFCNCKKLSNIFLPTKLRSVGVSAFENCKSMTQVSMPSVETLYAGAFAGCDSLWSVYIGSKITVLDQRIFEGCTSLADVTLPDKLTSIGDNCFSGCSALESIELPSTVTKLGTKAFYATGLKSVTLPNLTTLGDYAFADSKNLETIDHPTATKLKNIGTEVFGGTKWLEDKKTEGGFVVYNDYIIYGASYDQENLVIPSGIKGIAGRAFAGDHHITTVTMPDTLTYLGDYAFENCLGLTSFTIGKNISAVGKAIAKGCLSLTAFTVDPANKNYTTIDGVLYNAARTKLVSWPGGKQNVVFADGIKSIGDAAFQGCAAVSQITVPKTVTSIGSYAFSGCSNLEALTLPNSKLSVTVGEYAFSDCKKLGSVIVPSSCKRVNKGAFSGCTALGELVVSSGVEMIGDDAFKDCGSIEDIVIPATVKSIGNEAFGFVTDKTTGASTKRSGFTVYSYTADGAAQQFAENSGHRFVHIANGLRFSGSDRYLTSVEISKQSTQSASTVVIASGTNFADALVGVPLAVQKNAPILLTQKESLPNETLNEIKRLGAKKAIILGGKGAVSENVETTLKANGLTTERISGSNRFATAANIADKLLDGSESDAPESVFFVIFDKFADTLSVSSVAAIQGSPIIYVNKEGIFDEDTAAYLDKIKGKVRNAYVIGGTGVITNNMKSYISSYLDMQVQRISGSNRYETCSEVNNTFADLFEDGRLVCLATGENYPDALSGGFVAAKFKAPMILSNGSLNVAQKSYLESRSGTKDQFMAIALGGTSAVSEKLLQSTAKLIKIRKLDNPT